MVRISEEKTISLDTTNGVRTVEVTLFVSNVSSLPAYDGLSGRIMVPGSAALIPDEGRVFLLGFDNEWHEWGGEE